MYEFVLRPTSGQGRDLVFFRRMARDLQNAAIGERRDAWQTTDFAHATREQADGTVTSFYKHVGRGVSINYGLQSAQLKEIREFDPEGLGSWSFSTQQQILRRVNKSFASFFRRVKEGDVKAGFPRFKSLARVGSVDMINGDGAKWDSTPNDRLRFYIQGIGHIKVHAHRPLPEDADVKSLSLKFVGDKYYVRVVVHTSVMRQIPYTGETVGIDMGVNPAFLTTSDGHAVPSPRHLRKSADVIAAKQQQVDASKRGSNNRKRHVNQLRVLHAKVARQRRDFHHKTALMLITKYDTIFRENLNILNMTKTVKPKPDPDNEGVFLPNGAAAKTGLNKSINDAAWGQFFLILDAKAEEAGRTVKEINPKHTSQRCEKCNNIDPASRQGRTFTCTKCTHTTDPDEQAARTIKRLGLESQQPKTAQAA